MDSAVKSLSHDQRQWGQLICFTLWCAGGRALQRLAVGPELDFLVGNGALKQRSQKTVLVSLQAATCLFEGLGLASTAAGLRAATEGDGAQDQPPPPGILKTYQKRGPAHQPLQLPDCLLRAVDLKLLYALPEALQTMEALASEMGAFKNWLTAPVQLDRKSASAAVRSVSNMESQSYMFLGYVHSFEGVASPTLECFLHMDHFAAYMSFQLAKGNGRDHIVQLVCSAKKVVDFLGRAASGMRLGRVTSVREWLDRLQRQIRTSMPGKKRDYEELAQGNKVLPAHVVVGLFDQLRVRALKAAQG